MAFQKAGESGVWLGCAVQRFTESCPILQLRGAAGKGQARAALIPRAHLPLWTRRDVVQGHGDHTKRCGYFLAQKGVCSINVNCYVILTGPQQGRLGVIIIIYRESTWAQHGPFQGHWPGPGVGLEPRLSAFTAGFPPTALPQKDRQNLSGQMLAIGRKF